MRFRSSIFVVDLEVQCGRRKFPSLTCPVFADNDKVLLADPEDRFGLETEGLKGDVQEGGSNLRSYNAKTSASLLFFVCGRQIVSRTFPRCAPNSEHPHTT